MNREELLNEIPLSYYDLIDYLLKKYGEAKYDYFSTPECKSKNQKVTRTGEGLFCHHIFEDRGGNLGDVGKAKRQPYEWQDKSKLVYCNYLEHLLLHLKILVLRQKKRLTEPKEIYSLFTTGGIFSLCNAINDSFMTEGTNVSWRKRCFEEIKENYQEYILLLQALIAYIKDQYVGEKNQEFFLKPGSIGKFSDSEVEILKVSRKKDGVLVKLQDGSEKSFYSRAFFPQLTYADFFDIVIREMCSGFDSFYASIYKDVIDCRDVIGTSCIAKELQIDFRGYGFPQFTDCKLDKRKYGSENVDEYLYKGLPSYSNPTREIGGRLPVFWRGEIPSVVLERNLFFVVRIKASINLLPGKEAFVRYKERGDLYRFKAADNLQVTDENNLLFFSGKILSTSDILSLIDHKYHSSRIDLDGNVVPASVVLTLAKEDYELLFKRYKVTVWEYLDGCYFE